MEYTIFNTNYYLWTQNFSFLKHSNDWNENFSLVCVEDGMLIFLAGKSTGGTPVKIFVQKVVRGNAVQMFSNFPAKSLSI